MGLGGRSKTTAANFPKHPLAFPEHANGAAGVKSGGRFVYLIDGRRGRLDDATHDGDAFVTFDDGRHETIKWNYIEPEPRP